MIFTVSYSYDNNLQGVYKASENRTIFPGSLFPKENDPRLEVGICHDPPTLPKTTIACENGLSPRESSLPTTIFQGLCQFQAGYPIIHPPSHSPTKTNGRTLGDDEDLNKTEPLPGTHG